jgi:hypothetical protein
MMIVRSTMEWSTLAASLLIPKEARASNPFPSFLGETIGVSSVDIVRRSRGQYGLDRCCVDPRISELEVKAREP